MQCLEPSEQVARCLDIFTDLSYDIILPGWHTT